MCDSVWKVNFLVKVKQQRFSEYQWSATQSFSWMVPFCVKQRFPETSSTDVNEHVLETCEKKPGSCDGWEKYFWKIQLWLVEPPWLWYATNAWFCVKQRFHETRKTKQLKLQCEIYGICSLNSVWISACDSFRTFPYGALKGDTHIRAILNSFREIWIVWP